MHNNTVGKGKKERKRREINKKRNVSESNMNLFCLLSEKHGPGGVQTTLAFEGAAGAGYALGNALASNWWWSCGLVWWHRIRSSIW